MSKIGKKPIDIPTGIAVSLDEKKNRLSVKGQKGELFLDVDRNVAIKIENNQVSLSVKKETKSNNALWGLSRSLIANMVSGIEKGHEKQLELHGVGHKAAMKGKDLNLNLGFSHPVDFVAPKGIEFKVEKNVITISGIDKQLVGQIAAEIRGKKKPEPYKGKGIRYVGEYVKQKAGKKTAGAVK